MRRKLMYLVLIGAAFAATVLYVGNVMATPVSGFTGTTLAMGRFGEIDVFNRHVLQNQPNPHNHFIPHKRDVWLSFQKTMGFSDLYVQSNIWQPNASTGWHTHPGHSLIIVTAGTVTAYEGDDPNCKPAVYTQGMGFVDPGGDHVHLIRNEGTVAASTIAVQLIPAGAERRIDAPDRGTVASNERTL